MRIYKIAAEELDDKPTYDKQVILSRMTGAPPNVQRVINNQLERLTFQEQLSQRDANAQLDTWKHDYYDLIVTNPRHSDIAHYYKFLTPAELRRVYWILFGKEAAPYNK